MPILKRLLLPSLLAALWLLGAATPAIAERIVDVDRIVAIVNDDIIMQSELDERVREVVDQLRQQGGSLPPADLVRRQILERMALERIQLQRAAQIGLRVDDALLNEVLADLAQQNNLTLVEFRSVLERDGIDFGRFREQIRDEILMNRLRQSEVESQIQVTEREIANYIEGLSGVLDEAGEYRVEHIVIAIPEGASAAERRQVRERAAGLLAALREGADFAQLAREHSDGPQAVQGGDLGWREAGQLPTLFADRVRTMQAGEVSELITTDGGIHIIHLAEVRRPDQPTYRVTQTRARHILLREGSLTDESEIARRLSDLRQRILLGDDFAALARVHSDDRGSAAEGGDLGWVNPGELVPQFEEQMNQLQPGEISEPFATGFGWHIVQVIDRRTRDDSTAFLRNEARRAVRQRKMEETLEQWLRRLRDEAFVEFRLEGS